MNIVKSIVVAFAFVLGVASTISAQTVHAIIACNTIDRSIGVGMTSDMRNMTNAVETIVSMLECEYSKKIFDGNSCTKANITKYINQLDIESDDIVIFFYGGHGTHAENNPSDPWPQMCMNTNIESLFMPLASVDKLIAAKQPKLRVILSNCCNKEQSGVSIKPLYAQSAGDHTELSKFNVAAFKKLFLETEGKVMMTSSRLGQYSWCSENGGLFTNYLLEVFDAVGANKVSADWKSICKATHDNILAEVIYDREGKAHKQEPYYEVDTDGGRGHVPPPPTPSTDDLFKALQVLVNPNLSVDQRLGKISEIKGKYFTSDAHVVTVGRNGTSKIMYEDVADFLRRLALSKNIKQVNVLEGDNTGRNSLITVHEVRF